MILKGNLMYCEYNITENFYVSFNNIKLINIIKKGFTKNKNKVKKISADQMNFYDRNFISEKFEFGNICLGAYFGLRA